jgi:hypothetical protein
MAEGYEFQQRVEKLLVRLLEKEGNLKEWMAAFEHRLDPAGVFPYLSPQELERKNAQGFAMNVITDNPAMGPWLGLHQEFLEPLNQIRDLETFLERISRLAPNP